MIGTCDIDHDGDAIEVGCLGAPTDNIRQFPGLGSQLGIETARRETGLTGEPKPSETGERRQEKLRGPRDTHDATLNLP
jgi:hypothetical protein